MELEAKHIIGAVEYVNQEAYSPLNIRPFYTGRGMVDRECFAVVGEDQYLQEFENVLAILTIAGSLFKPVEGIGILEALTDLQDARNEDNMGYSRIFYYPSAKVEGTLEATDYED